MYVFFKFLHVFVSLYCSANVTTSAIRKVFENRGRSPVVVAFAQELITYTDWSLSLSGVVLILVGGYGMVYISGLVLWLSWLMWSQVLFAALGAIWVFRLIPKIARARLAARFLPAGKATPTNTGGCALNGSSGARLPPVPLVAAAYLMVAKL